jgi:hypothetical protein
MSLSWGPDTKTWLTIGSKTALACRPLILPRLLVIISIYLSQKYCTFKLIPWASACTACLTPFVTWLPWNGRSQYCTCICGSFDVKMNDTMKRFYPWNLIPFARTVFLPFEVMTSVGNEMCVAMNTVVWLCGNEVVVCSEVSYIPVTGRGGP